MKFSVLLSGILLCGSSLWVSAGDFVLVKNGKSEVCLVRDARVGHEQKHFVREMKKCGVDLPLVAVRMQVASAVNCVVHTMRLPGGSRKIVEIAENMPLDHGEYRMQTLMRWQTESIDSKGNARGRFILGAKPTFAEDAKIMGLELPEYP